MNPGTIFVTCQEFFHRGRGSYFNIGDTKIHDVKLLQEIHQPQDHSFGLGFLFPFILGGLNKKQFLSLPTSCIILIERKFVDFIYVVESKSVNYPNLVIEWKRQNVRLSNLK